MCYFGGKEREWEPQKSTAERMDVLGPFEFLLAGALILELYN